MVKKGLKIKYNRVSSKNQTGNRFDLDKKQYDFTVLDKVSGKVHFKERPEGKIIMELIEEGKVSEITFEEADRCGRDYYHVYELLDYFEQKEINIIIRNLKLESRPDNIHNPNFKSIVLSLIQQSEYELKSLARRTNMGQKRFLENGGYIGRPVGSVETKERFMSKEKNLQCAIYLEDGLPVRKIVKLLGMSSSTVMKVKKELKKQKSEEEEKLVVMPQNETAPQTKNPKGILGFFRNFW